MTAQLCERVSVAEARWQLARLGGRPAIAVDRDRLPLGLVFAHGLLAEGLHPQTRLETIAAGALTAAPCVDAAVSLARLCDMACLARGPAERYAIAVDGRGAAIGLVDLLALPEARDRDFDSGVERFAHEAATPLMGVLSLATLLEDVRLAPLSAPQRDRLAALRRSAERIADELERLDWLTRVQAERTTFYPEPIALEELCQQALERALAGRDIARKVAATAASVSLDRRYALHLLTAAIEVAGGRFAASIQIEADVVGRDAIVSIAGGRSDAPHDRPLNEQGPEEAVALDGLQTLVGAIGGDASLWRDGAGRRLSLLLPGVATTADLAELGVTRAARLAEQSPIERSPIERSKTAGPYESPTAGSAPTTCDRAIVWTLASPRELGALWQAGCYVAVATSVAELLAKIERLAPQVVFLDYARDRDRQASGERLKLSNLVADRNLTIATIDAPTRWESGAGASQNLHSLRYPPVAEAVELCFAARVQREATVMLLDLRVGPVDREAIAGRLRHHCCRTVEIRDLGSAELFADIWQPDAIFCFGGAGLGGSLLSEIEPLAERLAVPCIIFDAPSVRGRSCRLDRSLVYWPTGGDPTRPLEPEAIAALQWLRSG
ncbi:MAG: hypothetical protein ACFB9N_00505 [Geitlerinemataceae cyanobacterium]